MRENVELKLNGKAVSLEVDPTRPLLWVLRYDLGLTGTKYGCGEGHCGACTVLVEGSATRSCLLRVGAVAGKEVTTIEGLAEAGRLHPVQQAFAEHDALQCGYCTPGMILNAVSLLHNNPRPSRSQIIEHMEGNLCRCGTYKRIIEAIQSAAQAMGGAQR